MEDALIAQINNAVKEAVKETVKETVNGKIDKLNEALQEHLKDHAEEKKQRAAEQQELREILQAKSSITFLFKSILGAGSLAAAYLALKSAFNH